MINAEVVHAAEASLGEGCVWSPVENLLIWVDINGQAVHRFDHHTAQPVGLWRYPDMVGNAAPRAGGGLALGLGPSVALTDQVGAIETVIELPGEPESNRSNDGAVDPRGRLFQGTMSHAEPGAPVASLYRVDGDGTARRVLSDVMISNGIGWSPDQTTMYYIDTLTFRVDRFDYDPDSGEIEGRRPFVTFDGTAGAPDGMTVDADGCLWVAMFGGYHVQRFSPDGETTRGRDHSGLAPGHLLLFRRPGPGHALHHHRPGADRRCQHRGRAQRRCAVRRRRRRSGQPTNLFAG